MGAKESKERLLDTQHPNYSLDDRFSALEKQAEMICVDLTFEEIEEYFEDKIRVEGDIIREKIKTIISYIEANNEKIYLRELKHKEDMSNIEKELKLFFYVKCANNLAKKKRERSNLRRLRHVLGNFVPTYLTPDFNSFKSIRKFKKSNKKIKKSQKSYRKVKKSVKSIKKRNIKH